MITTGFTPADPLDAKKLLPVPPVDPQEPRDTITTSPMEELKPMEVAMPGERTMYELEYTGGVPPGLNMSWQEMVPQATGMPHEDSGNAPGNDD
jgi:hypothetical protein